MCQVAIEVTASSSAATFLHENRTKLKLGGRAAKILFKTYLSGIGLLIWITSENPLDYCLLMDHIITYHFIQKSLVFHS